MDGQSKWNETFEKLFADLTAHRPSDRWVMRLVDHFPTDDSFPDQTTAAASSACEEKVAEDLNRQLTEMERCAGALELLLLDSEQSQSSGIQPQDELANQDEGTRGEEKCTSLNLTAENEVEDPFIETKEHAVNLEPIQTENPDEGVAKVGHDEDGEQHCEVSILVAQVPEENVENYEQIVDCGADGSEERVAKLNSNANGIYEEIQREGLELQVSVREEPCKKGPELEKSDPEGTVENPVELTTLEVDVLEITGSSVESTNVVEVAVLDITENDPTVSQVELVATEDPQEKVQEPPLEILEKLVSGNQVEIEKLEESINQEEAICNGISSNRLASNSSPDPTSENVESKVKIEPNQLPVEEIVEHQDWVNLENEGKRENQIETLKTENKDSESCKSKETESESIDKQTQQDVLETSFHFLDIPDKSEMRDAIHGLQSAIEELILLSEDQVKTDFEDPDRCQYEPILVDSIQQEAGDFGTQEERPNQVDELQWKSEVLIPPMNDSGDKDPQDQQDSSNKSEVMQKKESKIQLTQRDIEMYEASWKLERAKSPLSRKGSLGRFLGRMMHSKRFTADRLPGSTGPEPVEVPKRPPRRKTLANLDLNREPEIRQETAKGSVEQERSTTMSSHGRSATLSSYDRRRRGSIGRLFGRVLSARQLNSTEGDLKKEQESKERQQSPEKQQKESRRKESKDRKEPPKESIEANESERPKRDPFAFLLSKIRPIRTNKQPPPDDHNKVIKNLQASLIDFDDTKTSTPVRPPPPIPAMEQKPLSWGKPLAKRGKVQFVCQKCNHQWTSSRGIAGCYLRMTKDEETGIQEGQVLVRLFGQQCNVCLSGEYETAGWSSSEVEAVLTALRDEAGRRFYPEWKTQSSSKSHQKLLCQACNEGICKRKGR